MKIVSDYPPNIEDLRTVFPLSGKEIFTWGDIIYNPSGSVLSDHLIAHETVHCLQQGADIQGWWDRYKIDPAWRLEQELQAHRAEYRSYCSSTKDRNARARFLHAIAFRLSAPMYGKVITHPEAMQGISNV